MAKSSPNIVGIWSFMEKCPPMVVRVIATVLATAAGAYITAQVQHVGELEKRIETLLQEKMELQIMLSTKVSSEYWRVHAVTQPTTEAHP